MANREFADRLRRRARLAGVDIGTELASALETYYRLLAKWNAKINLTAFRLTEGGEDEAVDRLLVEPLAAARYVPPGSSTLLDAGSGGGSPAIPLALALPSLSVLMVEVKTRKSVFLREAVRVLGLSRVSVETARFEELLTRPRIHEAMDVVTVRAVRIEVRTLMTLQAFLKPGGLLLLFRGSGGAVPTGAVPPPLQWLASHPLLEATRSRLVVLAKGPLGAQARRQP